MRICHGKSKIGSNKGNFDSKIRTYSSCNMPINQVSYCTDSVSVLKCINNESNRFHNFESNRLTVIHSGSSPSEWHCVNMDDNAAGKGPKGLKLDAILKNDRWLKGPKFLWEVESQWCSGQILEGIASRNGLVRTTKVKTSSTVAIRAKRQRKGEPIITSSIVLMHPVMRLC